MLTLAEPDPQLWERFQRGRLSPQDLAEQPVVERWVRARALGAARKGESGRLSARAGAACVAGAEPLIDAAARALRRDGGALLVADADGVIIRSYGADLFAHPAVRCGLAEGVRWHEAERGTNAIGTALAERTAVAVVGGAHYEPAARALACYAVPVCDARRNIVAVLDISVPEHAAHPRFGVAVQALAASVESALQRPAPRTRPGAEALRTITFGADGEFSARLATPSGWLAPRGSVLVLHDTWGLDEHIDEVAGDLAAAGYVALAPDLYAREGERPVPLSVPRLARLRTIFDEDGSEDADRAVFDEIFSLAAAREQLRILSSLHMLAANRSLDRHLPVAVEAARYLSRLTTAGPRVALLGFAAGAALALELARVAAAPAAVIAFDGSAPCLDAAGSVDCPVFAFGGGPTAEVAARQFAAAVGTRTSSAYRVYGTTAARFFDPGRPSYDGEASADVATRVLRLLRAHLG